MDKRLNIQTEGIVTAYADIDHIHYQPTDWSVLERLAKSGYVTEDSSVVDYGCGKGRVAFYLNDAIGCRVTGIEFAPELYRMALENLDCYGHDRGVSFLHVNAVDYQPTDADTFYFFNPFSVKIFRAALEKIRSCPTAKRLVFYWPMPEWEELLSAAPELALVGEIDCRDLTPLKLPMNKLAVYDVRRRNNDTN